MGWLLAPAAAIQAQDVASTPTSAHTETSYAAATQRVPLPFQSPNKKILLIPLDDRPATTQFAQMIGAIDGVKVETPPSQFLGRFTVPGNPEGILGWMRGQDLSQYEAVVVSTDMLCFGGLIASRVPETPYRTAINRLRALQKMRREYKNTPFYAFTAIMRLSPTALRSTAKWRDRMTQYATLRAKLDARYDAKIARQLAALEEAIPGGEVERYYTARKRNHMVQQELVRMAKVNVWDYLILGQDDAQPVGPHIPETARLHEMVRNLKVEAKTYFCEGIDQHSNVLISRAVLTREGWMPRVRVVFADEIGRRTIAAYEADHVEASLRDQLFASGARIAGPNEDYDYSLYVNTPDPRPFMFHTFVQNLTSEIDQGFPVAVADINLGKTGTGDPVLFEALSESGRAMRLLSYAGWNTAGNTMGTAIPAANVYLLARRSGVGALARELNQRSFLLHRLVNDFEYHRFTRPKAYAIQDKTPASTREETYGTAFDMINDFVRDDIRRRLDEMFRNQFQGRRFFAGDRQYEFLALANVDVELPWPRAYEVKIGFQLQAQEVPPRP